MTASTAVPTAPPPVCAFPAVEGRAPAEAAAAVLGGKGAGLLLMTELGLPVPPGFVITTAASELTQPLREAVAAETDRLARRTGRTRDGLVVAVRSGAPESMPGMLQTVLDVPLHDGHDGLDQLYTAIEAVWDSWHGAPAHAYRTLRRLDERMGTAVVVQAMVDGTAQGLSGTGVLFTRDPATGEPGVTGEFLPGARGPELVGGTRTPNPLSTVADADPELYRQLTAAADELEAELADMCEIEFTVESGRLWLLQVRAGKRTAVAARRIAVDLADQGLISRPEAVDRGFAPMTEREDTAIAAPAEAVLCRGLPGSPGAAAGRVALDLAAAERLADEGNDVILVRRTTDAADIAAMALSAGVLTATGGTTSHAAVVARELGVPCVCGAADLEIDTDRRTIRLRGRELPEGAVISIDGARAIVAEGTHTMAAQDGTRDLAYRRLLTEWAETEF